MKIYSGDEVRIPHVDLVRLRHEGKVFLGIDDQVARRIALTPELKPTQTTAAAAFHFWNWIVVLGFLYTVYLSFTARWWWFIVGMLGAAFVRRATREANQDNMMDAAIFDRDFYERIADLRGWHFKMESADAGPYLTQDSEALSSHERFRLGMRPLSD